MTVEVYTMAGTLIALDVRTREQWRRWLAKHHTSSPGTWLVRYKQHTGVKSMPYEDLVREALCFGWVDSLIKRLDDDRYAIKVTPRKPTSKWSDINRRRWNELEAAGQLAAPGVAMAPTENRYLPKPAIPLPPGNAPSILNAAAAARGCRCSAGTPEGTKTWDARDTTSLWSARPRAGSKPLTLHRQRLEEMEGHIERIRGMLLPRSSRSS